jgi:superfamily II DNA or RNA helicase
MNRREEVQDEGFELSTIHYRCGFGISMGVGKTLIGLRNMEFRYKQGKRRFLIVAPKKSIYTTWKEDAIKFDKEYLVKHMVFASYLGFTKLNPSGYDVVYLDECHSLLFSHELWLNAYFGPIIGLTGTPPTFKNSEKGIMVKKFCPIVYTYVIDEAVNEDILNDYRIFVHPVKLDEKRNYSVATKKSSFMSSEKAVYDYWTEKIDEADRPDQEQKAQIMRMHNMKAFNSKMTYAKSLMANFTHKSLLFCNTQQQADDMLPHSYHSKNKNSEQNLVDFKSGKIMMLSCVLSLSEGVNIPNLKECIIAHAYSNERKSSQRIGRMLRLNPNDMAVIHILMYQETVDEKWVQKALDRFDPAKITYHARIS